MGSLLAEPVGLHMDEDDRRFLDMTNLVHSDNQRDGVANWVERNKGGSTTASTANAMNEYATVGGVAQGHDENGNLMTDGSQTYVYDFANRLIQVKEADGTETARYTYDGLGRRIQKVADGETTSFFYQGVRAIEERNEADVMVRQYVYGRGIDEVLELTSSGQSFFYHDNSIGSVVALTNGLGQVQERYRYKVATPSIKYSLVAAT